MISTRGPSERTARMKHLQGFAQRGERIAARNPGLTAKGVEYNVRSGERAGMTVHGARRRRRAPAFTTAMGLPAARAIAAARARRGASLMPSTYSPKALTRSSSASSSIRSSRRACLVADGEDVAYRHRSLVEHQGERNRAALTDQRHTARDGATDNLVRPERNPVEEIHKAIAVGSEEGQRSGACDELLGELRSLCRARFGETRRKAHEAAAPARRSAAATWATSRAGTAITQRPAAPAALQCCDSRSSHGRGPARMTRHTCPV